MEVWAYIGWSVCIIYISNTAISMYICPYLHPYEYMCVYVYIYIYI